MKCLVLLTLLLAGCGTSVTPSEPGLPSVADLARMTAETDGYGLSTIEHSPDGIVPGFVTEMGSSPVYPFVWYIGAIATGDPAFFDNKKVTRIYPQDQLSEGRQGQIFVGVADFASGAWRWQDCSVGDLGIDIDPSWDIHSGQLPGQDAGIIYVAYALYSPNGYCRVDADHRYDYEPLP